MTSESHNADAFSLLDQITHKRTALENLISIAVSIHNQQKAMEGLSLIARPSQEIPAKTVRHLQAFETKHAGLSDDELTLWLQSIEETTHKLVAKVALLANLELQELRDHPLKGLSIEGFKSLVADFERRTQTSLALRFVLKNRGVMIPAFKLPFPQESIAEQVQALKEKEEKCIAQIKAEAKTIIADTQALLGNKKLSEKIKAQLLSVQEAMELNVAHLDNGGSVATIPNKFEVVILQNETEAGPAPASAAAEPAEAPAAASTTAPGATAPGATVPAAPAAKPSAIPAPEQPAPKKKLSTFRLFLKWLTTPMQTTWKSLKEENEKRK